MRRRRPPVAVGQYCGLPSGVRSHGTPRRPPGAACPGYGFAWFPEDKIRDELSEGILKLLPLRGGGERTLELYLIFGDPDAAGPGTRRHADIIREEAAMICSGSRRRPGKDTGIVAGMNDC